MTAPIYYSIYFLFILNNLYSKWQKKRMWNASVLFVIAKGIGLCSGSVQVILYKCAYLKIMISSSLSWRLLYCCKQMLQWSCLGWSPLLTALRRCDRDQWRSEFNRFVVVSNNVWEKERKTIAKLKKNGTEVLQRQWTILLFQMKQVWQLYCMFVL